MASHAASSQADGEVEGTVRPKKFHHRRLSDTTMVHSLHLGPLNVNDMKIGNDTHSLTHQH